MPRTAPELPERDRRILALLVREYIERGEPVSSLWLAERSGVGLSSATVRNALARLEEAGFVYQPHTSAGRVPTDLAYRYYVNLLLLGRRSLRLAPEMEARLRLSGSLDDVLAGVSHELSRASHCVGFALVAADEHTVLRHVDFVSLDATRVLVVLVASGEQVWQKVVQLDEAVTPSDLQQAANYLNLEFAGLSLHTIRAAIVDEMHRDRALYDQLIARALRLASASLDSMTPQPRLHVHGVNALLDETAEPGAVTLPALRTVLAMLEEKHRLVQLLTEYIEGPGLTVVIGAEHSTPSLHSFSLVAATSVDGATVGVLGPRRMRYSKTITTVEGVSHVVERLLHQQSN